jgi:hypothetical protein
MLRESREKLLDFGVEALRIFQHQEMTGSLPTI